MITRAELNIVQELSGKPALERLREVFSLLSPAEQQQAERALHLGIVIDEHKDHFERGDFLIRNLIGADQQTGGFAVGDIVKEGQTVQFQLRDAAAASEDFHALLTGERAAQGGQPPAGALIFSCNGRGQRFFRASHHDAGAIQDEMGSLPVAGFFAMGEIGPVGGNNFLHSYTASVALFQRMFVAMTGQGSDIAIVMTLFVLATVFTPVKNTLQERVDRRIKPGARPTAKHSTSIDDLLMLSELHSRGVLTDEEFAAKKRQLLGI